jgi:hypothetical protein
VKHIVPLRELAAVGLTLGLAAIPSVAQAQGDTVSVPCSAGEAGLRTAINNANGTGPKTIILDAGCTYRITHSETSDPQTGLPDIQKDIRIIANKENSTRGHQCFHKKPFDGGNDNNDNNNDNSDDEKNCNATIMRSAEVNPFRYRIFKVNGTGHLSLKEITVTAGGDSISGAGIFNDKGGTLTLEDCKLTGNEADGLNGGGIFNNGGTVTIKGSKVVNNESFNKGGGIFNTNAGTVTVEVSKIASNEAESGGGGIFNDTGSTVRISKGAVLVNRSSFVNGGGIFNLGKLMLDDSVVAGNAAPDSNNDGDGFGGGIFNGTTGTATIQDSVIIDNEAGFDGGGIDNERGGTLDISRSTVESNTAGRDGGGINNVGKAKIQETKVTRNSAGRDGGGLNNNPPGTATVERSEIEENTAAHHGGGVNNNNPAAGSVTLTKTEVSNNVPHNCFPSTLCP